jgi:ubiquinone/menaquinone biosynthesis C-methylase UbiE
MPETFSARTRQVRNAVPASIVLAARLDRRSLTPHEFNWTAISFMRIRQLLLLVLSGLLSTNLPAAENASGSTNRSNAIKALCARLEIGPGAVVADVGCGDGPDTMVFAAIVGERGTVLAQEIDTAKLKNVVETADKRGFHQVVPVLGQSEDPHLPDGYANLIYMNRVFHHFARPQAMLQHLLADLKPGGWLVIVDQQKGPLTDWTPVESREKQHHWTSELTVVRLAREAGFLFHDVLDDLWFEKPPFVLVFRKPVKPVRQIGDPDPARLLDADAVVKLLPLPQAGNGSVVFCGLDAGREVLPVLKAKAPTSSRFFDLVLEEWALSKEELPPAAQTPGVEILRTEKGDLALPADVQPGLVLFVDAYQRLWDPAPLLRRLKQQMPESGRLVVLDRKGPEAEPRRLANHRRRISPTLVTEEMRKAGFQLQRKLPAPEKDRFILVFAPDLSLAK